MSGKLPFASEPYPTGRTESGRTVIVCYCGGGDIHEWKPNGGGARILACFSEAPIREPARAAVHGETEHIYQPPPTPPPRWFSRPLWPHFLGATCLIFLIVFLLVAGSHG